MDKGIDCLYPGTVVKGILVDSASDKLYINGIFTQDGNCVPMRGMAQWNGYAWDSIGNATEGIAIKYGLRIFNDTLYLSGNFYNDNTNTYFAKWNGSFWDTLNQGPNSTVLSYAERAGVLYMGGTFDFPTGDSIFMIKKYDGTQFLGEIPYCFTSSGGYINAMAFYQDTLYVGGYYNLFPCKTLGGLGKWDGTALQLLGPEFANDGSNCNIQAMVEYQGELYIGGYFLQANGYAGNHIMKWNGTSFSTVGSGMNNRVRCMKVYNNKLYVGGDFTNAGGVASNYVAMWDGSSWNSLTTDVFAGGTITVEAINVYHDSLIIGGTFTSINGDTAMRKIVKYNHTLTGINELNQDDLMSIYPNPSTNQITLEFELIETKNVFIEIKNVLGQTIKTMPNNLFTKGKNRIEMDVDEFSQGIYFIQLQSGNKISAQKFIKK